MAAAVNKSFVSPAANAEYPVVLHDVAGGLLARAFNSVSGTSMVITVLLLLVAYDQCALPLSSRPIVTDLKYSQIHMEQRQHHWSNMENPILWAFSRIRIP